MDAHTRIDAGVKRGPRPPQQTDPDTGRFLPVVPLEERRQAIENAADRIAKGELLQTIAEEIGVTKQCLSQWLLDDLPVEYHKAQRRGLIARIALADHGLDVAQTPLDLARAREQAKFARWDAERRLPRLFGQQTHVTVEHVGDLGERLRRAQERVIEGEVVAVTASPQCSTTSIPLIPESE